jgi:DNA-binding XRE family transcriptional regulator
MKIRKLLVEIREKKGLSLRQAGEVLQITFQNLYFIEKCMQDGSIDLWKKIQKGYEIKDKDMWKVMTTYKYVENKSKTK